MVKKEKKRNNLSDQFRKQQHKLEIKKNKQQRKQNKEVREIRNDIAKVREELEKLEKLEQEGCLDNALRPKKMRLATYYGKLLTQQEKDAVKAASRGGAANAYSSDSSSDNDNSNVTPLESIPGPPPGAPPQFRSLSDVPPPPPPPLQQQQYQFTQSHQPPPPQAHSLLQFQPQMAPSVMPYGSFNESAVPSYAAYLRSQTSRITALKKIQQQEEAYQKECEARKQQAEKERAEREAEAAVEREAAAATQAMLDDVKFMPMALRVKRQKSLAETRKAGAHDAGAAASLSPSAAKKPKVVVQDSVLSAPAAVLSYPDLPRESEKKLDVPPQQADEKSIENGTEATVTASSNDDDDEEAFTDFMNDMKDLGAF